MPLHRKEGQHRMCFQMINKTENLCEEIHTVNDHKSANLDKECSRYT